MSAYTLTPEMYAILQAMATEAEKRLAAARKLPGAVDRRAVADYAERVAVEAERVFHEHGYPDDWTRWQRLADDARLVAAHSW